MKITIPQHLKQNKILQTLDTLSFAKYVTYKPMSKRSIQIDSNVLIYVTQGAKVLHLIDSDVVLKAGDVLFLKSGNYIMSEVLDGYYEALMFFYSDALLTDFIQKYGVVFDTSNRYKSEVFRVVSNSYLQNGLLSIIPYFDQQKDANIVRLKLEEMFLYILNSDTNFISFLQYAYEEYDSFKTKVALEYEKFDTIKELARAFKMSELNFRNRFKEEFGTTPKKWVLSQRLHRAKLLLEESEFNVSEVCREVGFDNISWFVQSYKKEFGHTPKKQKLTKNR